MVALNMRRPSGLRYLSMSDNGSMSCQPLSRPQRPSALVLQNVLLSGEAQLEKAKPEVWGAMPGIEMDRTGPEIFREFMEIKKHPANNPIDNTDSALPELEGDWIRAIEKGWIENVGKN